MAVFLRCRFDLTTTDSADNIHSGGIPCIPDGRPGIYLGETVRTRPPSVSAFAGGLCVHLPEITS